jgi:hypothetical protein
MNFVNTFAEPRRTLRVKSLVMPAVPSRLPRSSIGARWRVSFALPALCAAVLIPFAGQAQGALTNGGNEEGTLAANTAHAHTFLAIAGDRIVLQIAKLSGGAGFTPTIEVFAPDGVRLGVDSDGVAARLDLQAALSGTYTVRVSDLNRTGSGTYRLRLAQVPGAFTVPAGDQGGAMTNGVNHQGAIDLGDLDLWAVSANPGDRIAVQIAELSGGAGFTPMIELFAPDGTRLGLDSGGVAARLDAQAGTSGTYTVLVSDFNQSGTGSYELHLAQVPGSSAAPAGDEGGTTTDGVNHDGVIPLGDFDLWTFAATLGDRVTVQITELTGGASFAPRIEVFAPNGERKGLAQNASVATLALAIEVGGTYIVLVSDSNETGAGTYRLNLTRGAIAPPGANVLTNGGTHLGTLSATGETNTWTFPASAGESIVVRMGETAAGGLVPWLRVYGPDGVLLGADFHAAAAEVAVRATNSGTFSVTVADGSGGRNQTGDYRISLAKTGSGLVISPSDEGGALTNGTTYLATIDTGDVDAWTFTANAGESIAVWMGEVTAGSTLIPWLRLFGPDGALLGNDFNVAAAEVTVRATNSGTFTVIVADGNNGRFGTGNYRLSMAKTGSGLAISPSDEGGVLTNGTTYLATIDTGDVDAWTFTANAGENIIVRVGETATGTLIPWLRLFGPNGVLLGGDFNAAAAEVTARATNSGTFTVIVADGNNGRFGTGNYRLSLVLAGSPMVASPGDEGGPMTGAGAYDGTIDTGDIDAWTFTACAGDIISLNVTELVPGSTLTPWIRLYGWDGVLLRTLSGLATAQLTNFPAPASGTYTVVVGDGNNGVAGTGTYRLTVNGLVDELRLCVPMISGANGNLTAIGGVSGAAFILLTTTDVATPPGLWTPALTGQFDQFGVSSMTNVFNPLEPQRFFLLQTP